MAFITIQGQPFDLTEEHIKNTIDKDLLNLCIFSTIFDCYNSERYGKIGGCGQYTGQNFRLLIKRLNELGIHIHMIFKENEYNAVELIGGENFFNHSISRDELGFETNLCKASLYYWLSFMSEDRWNKE